MARFFFWSALLFCLTPWASPPMALAIGLALAMTVGHPHKKHNGKVVKILLQVSVVGLGFGMNFSETLAAGRSGISFTLVSIVGVLIAGYLIGRLLRVPDKTSQLVSVGTAICGGSAIAAMAPVIDADEKDVAVALGTVFILNAVALFIFPWMGHALAMSQRQFGLWSAIAIHDTSSVVGAASRYGTEALKIAATVKLTRALWILPLTLGAAFALRKTDAKIAFPYFIVAFVGASIVVSLLPSFRGTYAALVTVARTGLTVTLFLIGAGLTPAIIKSVGLAPVAQGVILWALVSVGSLWAVWNLAC